MTQDNTIMSITQNQCIHVNSEHLLIYFTFYEFTKDLHKVTNHGCKNDIRNHNQQHLVLAAKP